MKIFWAILIVVGSAFLLTLPFTQMVYDFVTDQRLDDYSVTTGAGITTYNVTLHKSLYDDDLTTVSFVSDVVTDVPVATSYNSTNQALLVSGLTASDTRTLDVYYDYDALEGSSALMNIIDKTPWFWFLCVSVLPITGLAGIFIKRLY